MKERSSHTKTPNRGASSAERFDCANAEELLSSYIDSMTSAEEAIRVESHLAHCAGCQRQLQSLTSLRQMLARVEPAAPPEDLVLDTRVKLSQIRSRSSWDWLDSQLNNVLKPLAMPALMGVSLTMLFFGVLFGSLVSNSTVLAQNLQPKVSPAIEKALVASDGNPQWNNPEVAELDGNSKRFFEPVTFAVDISERGRAINYNIIAGPRSPGVEQRIKEILILSQFTPATSFGTPVVSTIILTLIDVRG
jgi:hypothetical protein